MNRCGVCGCVDDCACVREGLLGLEACHWVEADLCSACAEEQDGDTLLLGWNHPPRSLTDPFVLR